MKQLYKACMYVLVVLSFSSYGQTFIQNYRVAGAGSDQLRDITTDNSDNFYVTGEYTNQITIPKVLGTTNAASKTFMIRYDAAGTVQWSNSINASSPNSVKGLRIAVDNAGNSFVVGSFTRASTFFNGFNSKASLGPSATSTLTDVFVAKYNRSNNDTLEWVMALGASGYTDELSDLAIDVNGDVYITGFISGTATVYGRQYGGVQNNNIATINSQGGVAGTLDAFVAKFSNNGTYQWGFSLGSAAGADIGSAITTDASNVYVSGVFYNTTDFDPSAATANQTATSTGGDAFIAKYTYAGLYSNVGVIAGQNVKNLTRLFTNAGNLYVAGGFSGSIDVDPSATSQFITSTGGLDIFLAKYDATTFAPVFTQKIGGTGDDEAKGLKVDASGNCYVTGYFSGTSINFNPTGTAKNLTSAGGKDIFISKYSTAGINSWAFSVGGTTDDQGSCITFNALGNIYAGGFYTGTSGDFDPSAASSTLPNSGLEDSYIAKYQECSLPVISVQPTATQTICSGASINLTFSVTGTGITYQWKKDASSLSNGGTISGATSSTLTITPSVAGDAGTYTCVATSCGNTVTSNNAGVIINTPPAITAQPQNASICSGNAFFTVTATGTLPTYQWKRNGVAIANNSVYSGVTAATLNLTSPTASNAGTFTVDISGSCAPSVTTEAADLTVGTGVSITLQPTASSVCPGATASFTVSASGATSYKWQKNNVNISDGGTVSGSSTTTLSITGVVAGDAATYRCVITGPCGTVNSNAVALTIGTTPSITTQPAANQTNCIGQTASFSFTASGAVSYQWKKDGVNISNTANITGATTANLQLASIASSDAGTYTCVVTGSCAPTVTTNNSVLVVYTLPTITSQPSPSTVCAGLTTSFTVAASGSGLTYKWQKNNVDINDGGVYSGSSTVKLTLTGVSSADAGNYRCVVSGSCSPSVSSTAVALVVNSTASITTHPVAVIKCTGQTASFTVGTAGTGITFQWQKDGVNLTDGGKITGTTTASLSINTLATTDAGNYRCVVTNACSGALNSNTAALTINSTAIINTQPSDQTICGSSSISFTVAATGTGLTYQWKKDGVDVSNSGSFSGATTATLSINPANASKQGSYTVVVTGTCNTVTSTTADLVVGGVASITTQPQSITVCSGSNAQFDIVVSGSGLSYQWQKNGINLVDGGKINGVTTASLLITGATASEAGSYTCITGNACSGSLVSSAATLSINAIPAVTKQPKDTAVCSAAGASFTINATGAGIAYQWKKNGINLTDGGTISGVLTNTLVFSSALSLDAGTYTVEVTGTCSPMALSNAGTLIINAATEITKDPISQAGCPGSTILFVCEASGGGLTYQWKKDGATLVDGSTISGATTASLTISSLAASNAGSYVCEVFSNCSAKTTSASAVLTINTPASISSQTFDTAVCKGSNAIFKVVANGSSLAYQWLKNGVALTNGSNISGVTTAVLTISNSTPSDDAIYTCDITSNCNFISSIPATLDVNVPASITTQPADLSACAGDNVSIPIGFSGEGLSFQWFKDGVALNDGGSISGSTSNTLQLSNISATDEAAYSTTITGVCGVPVSSNDASLTLSTPPVIVTQPSDKLTCTGETFSLMIATSNPDGVLYQWKKNGVNLTDGGKISGATTSVLTISSASNTDAATYVCFVSTSCTSPTSSDPAVVTITTASTISQSPANAEICSNQTATFKVVVSGGTGLVYQWQFKPSSGGAFTNISNGGKISGATTATIKIATAGIAEQGSYRCTVSEPCGASQFSASASLIINSPAVLQQPFPQSVCTTAVVIMDVIASGKGLSYQWFKDGIALSNGGRLSGVLTASLKITSTVIADGGDYKCEITGICGPDVTSDIATLTISPCTSVSLQDLTDPIIRIYPNPTSTTSTIEFKDRQGKEVNLVVFDAQGAIVADEHYELLSEMEEFQLPMEGLAHGMYFIQIQIGDEYYSDKVQRIP